MELLATWFLLIVKYAVFVALWSVTATDRNELNKLMLYFALTELILSGIMSSRAANIIRKFIISGELNNFLAKPLNFLWVATLQSLARIAARTIVPSLGFGIIILFLPQTFAPASLSAFALFILLVLLAIVMWSLLMCVWGMLAFWMGDHKGIILTSDLIASILSGGFMPLYLLPSGLLTIIKFTPFAYLSAYPIEVYTGNGVGLEAAFLTITVWILILAGLVYLLKSAGLRTYDANGS